MSRKGIQDPWRAGAPPSEAQANTTGSSESDHPQDWDLQPDAHYVLRTPGVSGWLRVEGAQDAISAAHVVMQAVATHATLEEQLTRQGFVFGPVNATPPTGFKLTDGEHTLSYPDAVDTPTGLRHLIHTLRYANNTVPGFRAASEEAGLFPVTT